LVILNRLVGLDPGGPILQFSGQYDLQTVHHKNSVKLVDLLSIVHRLQSTEGTSVAHFIALVLS
jgi:hypothetical protein